MSKVYRSQGEKAFDYKNFNLEYNEEYSVPIQIAKITRPYNLNDYLIVKLLNRSSRVLIQGQFAFILDEIELEVEDSIIVGVQLYRDEDRRKILYQTYYKITGVNISLKQGMNFTIPIQFVDEPNIKVTDDVAKYYFTIQVKVAQDILNDRSGVFLQQYSFFAMEI